MREMNQPCLLFDVFIPSGKDFLPRLLSLLPFKTHFSFFGLFCLCLTSPVPLISCPFLSPLSLSVQLPVHSLWCKVVIPFPLSLQSFISLSIFVIISPACPLVAPPVIHPSASYVKYLHLLSLSYFVSHSLPSLISLS